MGKQRNKNTFCALKQKTHSGENEDRPFRAQRKEDNINTRAPREEYRAMGEKDMP